MTGETLAWRAIKSGWRVLDRDGAPIGTVHRVLADDREDIFHGVAVKRSLLSREVEVLAARIDRIEPDAVDTSLSAAEVEGS